VHSYTCCYSAKKAHAVVPYSSLKHHTKLALLHYSVLHLKQMLEPVAADKRATDTSINARSQLFGEVRSSLMLS
jgi:hypothetical protein